MFPAYARNMRQLILMRHAKTEQPAAGQSDFSRELTDRGRLDAPLVAEQLVAAGARPSLALISDAVRTRQTWELVRTSFPGCPHRSMSTLYLAEPEAIIREAIQCGEDAVIVIGHNPGIHELASVMAENETQAEHDLHDKFPTSAAAFFQRESATSAWTLRAFVRAKDLRD